MQMGKPELAKAIAETTELNQEQAREIVAIILEQMMLALGRKEEIVLSGFGTFSPRPRQARQAKSLQDGRPITIPAHYTVIFRPHKKFKQLVN